MEQRPNSATGTAPTREVSPRLLHDGWFWGALVVGLAASWLAALWLGRSGGITVPWGEWRLLLWLVVLYPVIEEWLFRGLLQPWWLARRYGRAGFGGISVANVGTTLVFAGLHLFTHAAGWAALVLLPSLVFGWFRDRYNSILPGILLHCGYNLGYFLLFGLPSN